MRRLLLLLTGSLALGLLPVSGASADGVCPNEALRQAQGSTFLGDCRAYELVSPVDKGGVDVAASPSRTRASADGDAVQFTALGAFGDIAGTSTVGVEYLARRGADGWATHGIVPAQAAPAAPSLLSWYVGNFSEDLNEGVFLSLTPLTPGEPNVATVPNLYLRNDLLSAGPGSYRLLSACPACTSALPVPPYTGFAPDPALIGNSVDFSHVIFESHRNLTADASGGGLKLYESVNGAVRLAGILPDSACGAPPCPASQSVAGGDLPDNLGGLLTHNAISHDGSRIFFTAAPFTTSGTGRRGALYLRENGTTTVQVNASERATPEEPQPAFFSGASDDGSKVFFVTDEMLTDATTSSTGNLYMYDVNAPVGHRLMLISGAADFVLGMSDDGSYVYFTSPSRLLPEMEAAPPGEGRLLYVWHDGAIRYAGSAEGAGSGDVSWGEQARDYPLARVTPDGKNVIFTTRSSYRAGVLGYDNARPSCGFGVCQEVYLYGYDSNRVTCISCDPDGAPPLGDAGFALNSPDITIYGVARQHLTRAITDGGERVFFDTPDPLVPSDTNGKLDVYEYDVAAGVLRLISSGRSSQDSFFVEASTDGRDVFFITRSQLVGADVDTSADLYDARAGGGIAAQTSVPQGGGLCEGDACQGALASAPALGAPASLTLSGNGNLAAAPTPPASSKPKAKKSKPRKAKKKAKRRRRKVKRKSGKSASRQVGR